MMKPSHHPQAQFLFELLRRALEPVLQETTLELSHIVIRPPDFITEEIIVELRINQQGRIRVREESEMPLLDG